MIDSDIIKQTAERFSLPPAVVSALQGQTLPVGLFSALRIDPETAKKDPVVLLQIAAHAVATAFSEHHNLQAALSHVFTGDPAAYQSPSSTAGALVTGVLATAALNARVGMQGYKPREDAQFDRVAKDFGKYLRETQQQGGPVSQEDVAHWNQAAGQPADPKAAATGGAIPAAPMPEGPHPQDVEQFASQMKGLGVDVNHFLEHFPLLSQLRYTMLQQKTSLENYAPVAQMGSAEIREHVRSHPHPVYPNITGGEYSDAHDVAILHSLPALGRTPQPSVVARFASTGAKWNDVRDYYASRASEVPR